MAKMPLVFTILVVLSAVCPRGADAEGSSLLPGLSPAKGPYDLGMIFDTGDLLLGLESYQGGLGACLGWGNLAFRGLLDLTLNGSSQVYAVGMGVAAAYHILPAPISPYVGGTIGGGYVYQGNVSSAVTFSLGVIAGVEAYILDFLSVFAEYAVTAELTHTTDLLSAQRTLDYLVTTKMGNNAKLGIVIYFMRWGEKAK